LSLSIRAATPADISLIGQFIRDLAEYEKLAHAVRFDEAVMAQKLFGPRPYAEVLIGEIDGVPQGFALFFHNFSTFEGRPGIYLEDLFVRPDARGSGLGKALLGTLAGLAASKDGRAFIWRICSSDLIPVVRGLARRCWARLPGLRSSAIVRGWNGRCLIGTRQRLIFTRRWGQRLWTNGRSTASMVARSITLPHTAFRHG